MKNQKIPRKKIPRGIVEIIRLLKKNNFEAYIVGGAIRDILLNRTPKDFDLSTSATPSEIKKIFTKRATLIGKRFKLVHIFNGKDIVEVSTFRKTPDKKKQVIKKKTSLKTMIFDDNEFGTAKEDAFRRDFTVNSLFYDPIDEKLIDFTQKGLTDLHNSQVRAIGNPTTRFEEDPVRILRALKLIGQYNFSFEKETEKALIKNIKLITHASSARLLLEFDKIIKNYYSCNIFIAFFEFGFLKYFLPEINKLWGTRECNYMQKLLNENNKRVKKDIYRQSISVSLATIALPFVELEFGKFGKLWVIHPDNNSFQISGFVRYLFSPFQLSKWVIKSITQIIVLQPQFYDETTNKNYLLSHNRYNHARELLSIQSNINLLPNIEENWVKKVDYKPEYDNSYNNKPRSKKRKSKH